MAYPYNVGPEILQYPSMFLNLMGMWVSFINTSRETFRNWDSIRAQGLHFHALDENIFNHVNDYLIHFFSVTTLCMLNTLQLGNMSDEKPLIFLCELVNVVGIVDKMRRSFKNQANKEEVLFCMAAHALTMLSMIHT